jgi:hypothetical protein
MTAPLVHHHPPRTLVIGHTISTSGQMCPLARDQHAASGF